MLRPSLRSRALFTLVACGVTGGAVTAACTTTTVTTGITPITGVVIRADSLIAGFGCGTSPGQVFKYAAILTLAPPDAGSMTDGGPSPAEGGSVSDGEQSPSFSNIFDCFADGVFVNLPASPTGDQTYVIQILAFNAADFNADNGDAGVLLDAGSDPVALEALQPKATWTTACYATQQSNIIVLAVCAPLTPALSVSDAGVADATLGSDAGADAGADAGGTDGAVNSGDAGVVDAKAGDGADASGDAPADAPVDAPADAQADANAAG